MSHWIRVLKFIFALLMLGLIYYQISKTYNLAQEDELNGILHNPLHWHYLFIALALMPLNWALEAIKWQVLMSPHQKLNFKTSLRTVLAGLSMGIVTPARIGEYGGRVLMSSNTIKWKVVAATLLGSIAQNIIILIFGFGFSYLFLKSIFGVTSADALTFNTLISIQIIIVILIYSNLPEAVNLIERWVPIPKFRKYLLDLKSLFFYKSQVLYTVLGISLLRYVVYFMQYVFILKYFGVENNWLDISSGVAAIYLIQTGIPFPDFIGILTRGELAILVWTQYGIDEITALSSTFLLWIINLIIPSLVGVVILLKADLIKFFKSTEIENS